MKRLLRWLKGLFIEEVTVAVSQTIYYEVGDKIRFDGSKKKGTITRIRDEARAFQDWPVG